MRKLLSIVFFLSLSAMAFGQDGLPEKPEDGKCYAKCVTPDEYVEKTVKVMVQPAFNKLEVIPAEYKTVTDSVMIKPASKEFTYVPATYKTVYDTLIIKDGYNDLSIQKESLVSSSEMVTLKPAIGKWEMGAKLADCDSDNPEDCRTLCYREYPAVTTSVATLVLDKSQTSMKKAIRPKYMTVSKQVEVSPARVDEKIIPAKYKLITREVLVKDETTREIPVDAQFTEIKVQELQKAGGLTYWKEVACSLPKLGEILPINYKLGSSALTRESTEIIDSKLYQFLVEHPESRIELTAHTDSRGSSTNNLNLSRQRAQSVVNYLVNKGINRNRLVAQGKGEKELLNKCADGVNCSEYEHRINRRTSFRILNY